MKKIKLNQQLKLNKETISKLQESQMQKFRGGATGGESISCLVGTCNVSCNKGTCNGTLVTVN